ncbi:glutamate 5-kinase [Paenibacillus sp. 481]|uniref:glutamate 5-kinase n=1 Tax=Paenibacillus sp. 481 TaxID=2835869 RepID=UPI001E6481A9|nr:glutamate 5-kinase [Paenibacillus sp. 481]UHA73012.1 glutamate 5-kinase [Paenibacillus sp. 481]
MQRIVVKIGSSSLTSDHGGLNRDFIGFYVREMMSLIESGAQVVVVTSGAVAAGFTHIGYEQRPKLLHEKQAAAAVGQALLMRAYQEQFQQFNVPVAQILLTRTDFASRKRGQNAHMTIEELLRQGVVPIINENDTVSVEELKFGDNDSLSALVANLVHATRLVIITDTDGLYTADPRHDPNAKRFDRVEQITDEIYAYAGGSGSSVGTGGMRSKLDAARIAMRGGVPAFIGKVSETADLLAAVQGQGKGTYFDSHLHALPMKKQWLGFHSTPQGRVFVDDGAEQALTDKGSSLLPAGVHEVIGDFHPGDVIEVFGTNGRTIGRGIVNYGAAQLRIAAGWSSEEVLKRLEVPRIEVIHRDEWVTLK